MAPSAVRIALLAAHLTLPAFLGAQSAFRFTEPYGRYAVGFRTAALADSSRSFGESYASDGRRIAVRQSRPLNVAVWYPAAAGGEAMRYRDYAALYPAPQAPGERASVNAFLQSMGIARGDTIAWVERELDAPVHARRSAPAASGRFPVVIYAPSFNAPSFENDVLVEYLASHGYLVLASHSFGANGPMSADRAGMETQARDLEFLLAYARRLPQADGGRVGVIGGSWGGISNVLMAMRRPDVSAIVCLDGSIGYFYESIFRDAPFVDVNTYTTPNLFFVQGVRVKQPGEDSTFAFYDALRYADAFEVTMHRLRHMNFEAQLNRLFPTAAPPFIADRAVSSEGFGVVARYTKQFLDAYLKREPAAVAFLGRAPEANGVAPASVTIRRKVGLRPAQTMAAFEAAARREGLPHAAELADRVLRENPKYDLPEAALNEWGYRLLGEGRAADAVGVFRLNVRLHQTSANGYDSLAEGFLAVGDTVQARTNYERSLALDSTNANARTQLKKLAPKPAARSPR